MSNQPFWLPKNESVVIVLCLNSLGERLKSTFHPRRGTPPGGARYPTVYADERSWRLFAKEAAMVTQMHWSWSHNNRYVESKFSSTKARCSFLTSSGTECIYPRLNFLSCTVGSPALIPFTVYLGFVLTKYVQSSSTACTQLELGRQHRTSLLLLTFVDYIVIFSCDASGSSNAKAILLKVFA